MVFKEKERKQKMVNIYKNLVGMVKTGQLALEGKITCNTNEKSRKKKNIRDLINALTEMF